MQKGRARAERGSTGGDVVLLDVLRRALTALAEAGEPQAACLLGGEAYAALRHEHPAAAQRINALMHRLARSTVVPIPKETRMSNLDPDLDVRNDPPPRRHQLIFETYHALEPGKGFVLINDHDPKPLYYQFEAEHAGEFEWDYLEEGPEVWRVRIGRTSSEAAA